MRPCINCRVPIENRVTVCPQCGAAQDDGPRATPTPDRAPPGLLYRLFIGAVKFEDPFLSLFFFAIPILTGGVIGYFVGAINGAVLGFLVAFLAMMLLTLMVAAGDSGG